MGSGFPTAKFFRIINQDTGFCLAAAHGGTTHGAQAAQDRLTGETGYIPYSHTNDQILVVRKPDDHRGTIWFFDERKNTYGEENWHLVNANRDIRSAFTLHVGPLDNSSQPVQLGLTGWGQEGQTQWKADGGMLWPGSHKDKVVTLLPDGKGGYHAVVASRGAGHQQWRFQEVALPGESVPVRRRGIYETGGGGDPLKWRDAM
jgi:hypothetical protein